MEAGAGGPRVRSKRGRGAPVGSGRARLACEARRTATGGVAGRAAGAADEERKAAAIISESQLFCNKGSHTNTQTRARTLVRDECV